MLPQQSQPSGFIEMELKVLDFTIQENGLMHDTDTSIQDMGSTKERCNIAAIDPGIDPRMAQPPQR